MSKAEWGTKRRCASCSAPFYDMRRSPIRCPACGAEFKPDAPRSRPSAAKRVAVAPARPVATDAPDVENDDVDNAREGEDDTDNLDDQDEAEDRDDGDSDDDVPEDPEELASLDGPERA